MLVDPELAARARELLREPHEANGKGEHMSALGTHEITAGMSFGLEPPLSPPVVRGPVASALPVGDGLSGLPTPPPAIRPPESAAPVPAPTPQAEVPQQPEPAIEPAPAPAAPVQPEPALPVFAPEPVQLQPEPPALAPEPELPTMAPVEEPAAPVLDYFSSETAETTTEQPETELTPVEAPAPAEEPAAAEPTEAPALQPIPLVAPEPAPAAEPVVELPTMAPLDEPTMAPMPEPAAFMTPEPVALVPELETVDLALPVIEPLHAAVPETTSGVEELFAPKTGDFRVVVRLKDGEGAVEVGSFRDFGTAMEGAQEVIEQFSTATEGRWPFYAGRFIRPDLIVSVDVVEGDQA
jgi:hypothetical protein